MQKITEAANEKNHQIVGLKVLIFWLQYIAMYFADLKFPNKESVTTQAFAFSRFRTDIKWKFNLQHACKNFYSQEIIYLFHIKYKLLQFIHKTVDASHL